MSAAAAIPVTVLTGFLGSGKTTLLQRLLQEEGQERTAVLINEFGEIGLDHLIARRVEGDTVVLQNGCICCSVRSDLRDGLRDLLDGRSRGTVPDFERILVETTGLADPVPIVQTLVADPMLRSQVRLAHLVATVDALNGLEQLANQEEALRQAATADRLVVTKTDIAAPRQVAAVRQALQRLNPTAPVLLAPPEAGFARLLLGPDAGGTAEAARDWLGRLPAPGADPGHDHAHHRHGGVRSFVIRTERPLDWTAFAVWLSLLVHRHGGRILRIKGLLDVPGARGPVLLNAVQHFIHPPVHLDGWPDADRGSRLVFIVQDLEETAIRRSLADFLARAEALAPGAAVGA